MIYIFIVLTLLTAWSCTPGSAGDSLQGGEHLLYDSTDFAHEVRIKYATGLSVTNHADYKEVAILSSDTPTDTLARYILYPRTQECPELANSTDARFIPVPAQSLATLSTTEVGALPLLGLREVLVASADLGLINDSLTRVRIQQGQVVQISQGLSRNYEQIIALRPDILTQSLSESTAKDEDIVRAGTEIVLFNNWKEETLLGRAEWFKLLGLIFGRNRQADAVFEQIEEDYMAAKSLLPQASSVLPILYGIDFDGIWYIPGERTYVTNMLRDAHLSYEYSRGQATSLPVSFEYIFGKHYTAPIWLCTPSVTPESLTDLVAMNERYATLESVRSARVWIDRKRVNPSGGNDIWESGVYQPHLLLKDLLRMTRPELLPDYEPTYWYELR